MSKDLKAPVHLGREYNSASQSLMQRAWRDCIPITCTLEVTLRCNLKCAHCYNFDRSTPVPTSLTARQLSTSELLYAVDALADAGCLLLSLSGGEALLHPNIDDIIARARTHYLAVTVKTNGTMLTAQRSRDLYERGVHAVSISLYGATAQTHDAFTKEVGSFDLSLQGLQAARAAGLQTSLTFNLVRHNAHESGQMLAMGEHFDCSVHIDPQLTSRYDGSDSPLEQRLDRETLLSTYRGPLRALQPSADPRPHRSVQCSCARSVCAISATGDVYPCIGAPLPSGNIRDAAFATIWKQSPQLSAIRRLELRDFAQCAPCPDRPWCRRSSGAVYCNTGEYTGSEAWTCMEAGVIRELDQEHGMPSFDTFEDHR